MIRCTNDEEGYQRIYTDAEFIYFAMAALSYNGFKYEKVEK